MIKALLNNLHPAMNKDAQMIPALTITATSGVAFIKDNILQLTGPSSAQYNLRSFTLGSLVTAINSQSGFTATTLQPSFLAAVVLIDGTYLTSTNIPMFTAYLWQLLKPVSLALIDALGAQNQALLEMVLNSSNGKWLDAFGELFNVIRQDGEPDQLYAVRVFDFTVTPRINNFAIQKSLNDLGYVTTISDNGAYSFDVNVVIPSSPPQGFYYTNNQIGSLVGLLKAAGTNANIILNGALTDGIDLADSLTSTLNSGTWTWGSFVWGKFSWMGG